MSKINKDELIRVTIGLAEPMGEGDTIRCLFMSQRSGRIYNVVQRVRGGYTNIIQDQRYNLLEKTSESK
jgi:hypothetical protein